jgi:hypothetical protein
MRYRPGAMSRGQNGKSISGGWAVDTARCQLFVPVFSWTPLTQRIGEAASHIRTSDEFGFGRGHRDALAVFTYPSAVSEGRLEGSREERPRSPPED